MPSAAQRKELKTWFAGARHCYNAAVAEINGGAKANLIELRKKTITKACLQGDKTWVQDTPSRVRSAAVADATSAYKACVTKLKNKQISHFKIHFRSLKHDKSETIGIEKSKVIHSYGRETGCDKKRRARRQLKLAPTTALGKLGPLDLVDSCKVFSHLDKNGIKEDCKLHWVKATNKFYLLVPREVLPKPMRSDGMSGLTAALDPGTRAFQTYYTPSGETGTLLEGMVDHRLMCLADRIDRLQSAASTCKNRQRARRMRKKQNKLWTKISNVRQNAHYAAIGFLWDNFDNIMIPVFGTARMVEKEGRCIGKRTTRKMLICGHYAFRQRLLHSRIHRKDKEVYLVEEGYTTRTCGLCGGVNHNVGSAKVFKCISTQCGARIGRDVNGARNIMLRGVFHGPLERAAGLHGQTRPA